MNRKSLSIWLFCFSLFVNVLLFANKERVAVIGGGGSGLTTAWLLDQDYDVTLFEAQNRLGGHANSIDVEVDGSLVPIEAGFEFISENQFPYFYNLLKNVLQLPLHDYTLTTNFYRTDSSSSLILPPIHDGKIEWRSLWPHDVFNMIEFDHLLAAGKFLIKTQDVGVTLEDFVDNLGLTSPFKNEFLYPFLAAGWGVTKEDIKKFAAYDALKYAIQGKEAIHYQWVEVVGGTQKYIQKLAHQLVNAQVKLSANISDITCQNDIYTIVEDDGTVSQFDHLVIATNAMQACGLLKNMPETLDLRSILGQIKYFKTTIAIHGDSRFMPADTATWSVVNVRYDGVHSATTVCKKWLSPASPVFKSWITYDVRSPNDQGNALPSPLYALEHYDHPIADLQYFQAQKAIGMVQGNRRLWFAGNYTHDNDSHESAIMSAINVAKRLAPHSDRLNRLLTIQQ